MANSNETQEHECLLLWRQQETHEELAALISAKDAGLSSEWATLQWIGTSKVYKPAVIILKILKLKPLFLVLQRSWE